MRVIILTCPLQLLAVQVLTINWRTSAPPPLGKRRAAVCCCVAALAAVFPVCLLTQAFRFRADGTEGRWGAAGKPWKTGVPGIKGLFCDFCRPWRCQAPRGGWQTAALWRKTAHLMTRPSHIKGDSQVRVSTRTKLSSCTCSPPLFEAVHSREERIFYVEPPRPPQKNKTKPNSTRGHATNFQLSRQRWVSSTRWKFLQFPHKNRGHIKWKLPTEIKQSGFQFLEFPLLSCNTNLFLFVPFTDWPESLKLLLFEVNRRSGFEFFCHSFLNLFSRFSVRE